jgi:hypothetical protein
MNEICCLKLTTGEELIGTRVLGRESVYKDLASIVMMPSENGKANLAVMPFLGYSDDDEFHFNPSTIILKHKPNQDLINYYNRIFGAGIQVVSSL